MSNYIIFLRFGAALLIGILIGLQREYSAEDHPHKLAAGIRTFPLLALCGCTAALLSEVFGSPWPLVAVVFVIGLMLTVNYYIETSEGDPGLTTNASAIVTVLAGALAYTDKIALAVAVGVLTTLLLSAKSELHNFVRHLTKADVLATVKFAVITAVILPVLPNRVYGTPPFDVFNPFKIWLLVIFVSGVSFVGYILSKTFGPRNGLRLTGLLGGLASSTAVTLSITQMSRERSNVARALASAIISAWSIMFIRVLIIAAIFNTLLVRKLWLPVLAVMCAGGIWYIVLYMKEKTARHDDKVRLNNPFALRPAIKFAALFTLIMAVVKAANVYFGSAGTYLSAFLAGCADVDAIVLSVSKFSIGTAGGMDIGVAGRAVMIAAGANTLVKGVIVLLGGSKELKIAILPGWIIMTAVTAAMCFIV